MVLSWWFSRANETVAEAAKRELFEEVGLSAGYMELYTVASGADQHFSIPMVMKFILLILFLFVMIFLVN